MTGTAPQEAQADPKKEQGCEAHNLPGCLHCPVPQTEGEDK